jgi:2-oxoglutarate ferredoxin oxidoreductase subunit beta
MSNSFRKSNAPPKWCPGCGDYTILNSLQLACEELQIKNENLVIVSGIGCSSRLPYHFNAFGYHTIHGRAPTIAMGLYMTRPELNIVVVTGDGDGLSIGGNHLIHLFRRNPNVTVLLFNNEIYGLTKGQHSPTTKVNNITMSSPEGTFEQPINSIELALVSRASFVARAADFDRVELRSLIKEALLHKGTAFLEILQNCIVFNDKTHALAKEKRRKIVNGILYDQGKESKVITNVEEKIGSDRGLALQLACIDTDNLITGVFFRESRELYPTITRGPDWQSLEITKLIFSK